MKKYLTYIKDWLRLVKSVRELEKDVENLETKLLAPEEVKPLNTWAALNRLYYSDSFWGISPSRKMSIEEKVDAIAEALQIKFEWTEEKEKKAVAKLPKAKKEKKK